MPSLYARYVAEKYGQQTLETGEGFIVYKVSGKVCYVELLYVLPEFRRSRAGTTLMDRVAATLPPEVKYVSCEIDTSAVGGEQSYAAVVSYGFEPLRTQGSNIVMVKYL